MDRKTDSVSVPGILGRMSPEALSELIFNIANTLVSEGKAGTLTADLIPPQAKFAVMRPKDRAHGDWASNAAMQLAKKAGMKPRDFAELFAVELTNADGIKSVEVAGPGFINITLDSASAAAVVDTVLEAGSDYGKNDHLSGKTLNLEFVSANPTGPIHIGGTRWAAVGDSMARVLEANGAKVVREYYFNDHGEQINRFAKSLVAAAHGEETPIDGYKGAYIDEIAKRVIDEANADGVDYLKCGDLADITEFFDEAKAKEYRDAAIPELTAAGVTFPIKVQMPYNPSSTDWDKQCQVFKQQLESVLNDGFDFIDIIITAGPSDSFLSSVRRNGKFAFLQCNWGADYSDPQTETDPFYQAEGARGSRYAFLRTGVEDGFITGDTADAVMNYMKAIEEAVKITDDINARYDAFANAEASLINNALVVPMGMSIPAYIATRLNYWEGQYASTGFSNKRLKGIHVLDHYISMSEYEANRDAR